MQQEVNSVTVSAAPARTVRLDLCHPRACCPPDGLPVCHGLRGRPRQYAAGITNHCFEPAPLRDEFEDVLVQPRENRYASGRCAQA